MNLYPPPVIRTQPLASFGGIFGKNKSKPSPDPENYPNLTRQDLVELSDENTARVRREAERRTTPEEMQEAIDSLEESPPPPPESKPWWQL